MTLQDREWYMRNTAPGMLARALGRDPFSVDADQADAIVEQTRQYWARNYGKILSADELARARITAELRSAPSVTGSLPADSYELAAAVKRANPGRRSWTVQAAAPYDGAGMAMRVAGVWTADSDPAVIAASERAEEARRVENEGVYEAWRRAHIGAPT